MHGIYFTSFYSRRRRILTKIKEGKCYSTFEISQCLCLLAVQHFSSIFNLFDSQWFSIHIEKLANLIYMPLENEKEEEDRLRENLVCEHLKLFFFLLHTLDIL